MVLKSKGSRSSGQKVDNGEKYKRRLFTKQNIMMIMFGASFIFGAQLTLDLTKGTIVLTKKGETEQKQDNKLKPSFTKELKIKYDKNCVDLDLHIQKSESQMQSLVQLLDEREARHIERYTEIRDAIRELRSNRR